MLSQQQTLETQYPEHAKRLSELSHQADVGFLDRSDLVSQVAELLAITESESDQLLSSGYSVNQKLVDYITQLKKGGYKIGLISNLGAGWFDTYVPEEAKLLFDDRVVSGEVGMVKPYPEIFELACVRLNVQAEDSIFIDDLVSNCDGARSAGMQSVQYENFNELKNDMSELLSA